MSILILNEQELRSCVPLDMAAIEAIKDAFTILAHGGATIPPIMRIDIDRFEGETDVKAAYVDGVSRYAVKIASGFHRNRERSLPTGSGLMVLLDAQTGRPVCVLLDNGYLTDLRTGAAGALAAKYLSRTEIENVGVIGAGMQARYQVRALSLVRDFKHLAVYNVGSDQGGEYASEMEAELGIEVEVLSNPESVVRKADVLITSTPAREPIVMADWLEPGLHITAMGSDAEEKQELHVDVLLKADLLVCDLKSQAFRLGELHHAVASGDLDDTSQIIELGDIITGKSSGRTSQLQITICDLTGVGIQDTAIANLAYERAVNLHLGTAFD